MSSVTEIRSMAGSEPITMLTAYDAPTARFVEDAGVDIILVGDSIGNVVLGHETTLPVSVDSMAEHTAAVSRATSDVLVVADMPFLSVGVDKSESIRNCGRMLEEAGADAVKLECGPHTVELTERLVDLGIPVMAHLGLTPQRVKQLGGFTRQGTTNEAAAEIEALASAHEEAGAFALVLEHVPENLGAHLTETLSIPTIGIGAGRDCDGQVLVFHDVVGLSERTPPFAKPFGDVASELDDALSSYVGAVKDGTFPEAQHSHTESDLDELY
ncbi:3-methyl-2-oxobutanoate hydroxymethyltransferase [Halocatena halophila]|uniref:3-methyl-2-oxobutanoate hydroxymethyltransferase n=1 Tax=Halocatena halophila TaxID=2814576 RepID=UPI002ED2005A